MKPDTDKDTSFSQHWKKNHYICLFKMVKDSCSKSSVVSETSHKCGPHCLGPLTFHRHAVGDMVRLSHGGLLAERAQHTFRNGLVFSSRPVKVQERVRLRVQSNSFNWNGALRVGFTNVPPQIRTLPLPGMAIPDLTERHGHWAAPLPDSYCLAGSELEFWVTTSGKVYIKINNTIKHKLLKGVDVTQPLWALVDIYGQTCSVLLLGSEKKELLCTRYSCPAPHRLPAPDTDNRPSLKSHIPDLNRDNDDSISCLDMEVSDDHCCVCLENKAKITLPCGHRCLCHLCTFKISQEFGTCPLCRHKINSFRGGEELCV